MRTTIRSKTDPVNAKMYQGKTRSRCGDQACDDNNDTNSRDNPPSDVEKSCTKRNICSHMEQYVFISGNDMDDVDSAIESYLQSNPNHSNYQHFHFGDTRVLRLLTDLPGWMHPIPQRSTNNQSTTQETDLIVHHQ